MPIRKLKDWEGQAVVFITTTCVNWIPVFSNDRAMKIVATQFSETAQIMNVAIIAYVIMPSHLHALLGFQDIKIMPKFVKGFKSLSARKIKNLNPYILEEYSTTKKEFQLWKRRYDDLIITSDKQFKVKLEYIHDNPVRAELVKVATNWKYSSARDWLLNEAVPYP